ncbi:QcrA and Rieske domain-containing protein [Mucilaginibacter xinganensis]|uniref:Cytochrome b6-f complex iron-sulfur subunit n=1 Tax=Mucilaginibacter xinganensis TaxID=1234841 RepID=A0A223NQ80_9SPHI|nr:Rieske (2Fe-2S) protein [Mucilaginibacter xinganensis]ASU31987.1 cytochrome b6-f complex iron-sulfur subunit [Mucilaginibacter xinganensis]
MDRKEFFSIVGVGAASALVMSCVGCSKSSDSGKSSVTGPTGVNFTLDLTLAANAALLNNGGYLAANGVLVAKTSAGAYIAVQQSCTHQNYPLVYEGSSQQFFCNNHGSAFSEKGVVLNSPANRNLTVYNTLVTGTSLKVYS